MSPERIDPVSGNEIPIGATAENVRDDIPAQLSEGEYVVPADVVNYYGVKFFEDLRSEAKEGFQEMAETGRIGGEPIEPMMDEELPFDLSELEMTDEDTVYAAEGVYAQRGGFDIPEVSLGTAPAPILPSATMDDITAPIPEATVAPEVATTRAASSRRGPIVIQRQFINPTTGQTFFLEGYNTRGGGFQPVDRMGNALPMPEGIVDYAEHTGQPRGLLGAVFPQDGSAPTSNLFEYSIGRHLGQPQKARFDPSDPSQYINRPLADQPRYTGFDRRQGYEAMSANQMEDAIDERFSLGEYEDKKPGFIGMFGGAFNADETNTMIKAVEQDIAQARAAGDTEAAERAEGLYYKIQAAMDKFSLDRDQDGLADYATETFPARFTGFGQGEDVEARRLQRLSGFTTDTGRGAQGPTAEQLREAYAAQAAQTQAQPVPGGVMSVDPVAPAVQPQPGVRAVPGVPTRPTYAETGYSMPAYAGFDGVPVGTSPSIDTQMASLGLPTQRTQGAPALRDPYGQTLARPEVDTGFDYSAATRPAVAPTGLTEADLRAIERSRQFAQQQPVPAATTAAPSLSTPELRGLMPLSRPETDMGFDYSQAIRPASLSASATKIESDALRRRELQNRMAEIKAEREARLAPGYRPDFYNTDDPATNYVRRTTYKGQSIPRVSATTEEQARESRFGEAAQFMNEGGMVRGYQEGGMSIQPDGSIGGRTPAFSAYTPSEALRNQVNTDVRQRAQRRVEARRAALQAAESTSGLRDPYSFPTQRPAMESQFDYSTAVRTEDTAPGSVASPDALQAAYERGFQDGKRAGIVSGTQSTSMDAATAGMARSAPATASTATPSYDPIPEMSDREMRAATGTKTMDAATEGMPVGTPEPRRQSLMEAVGETGPLGGQILGPIGTLGLDTTAAHRAMLQQEELEARANLNKGGLMDKSDQMELPL